MSAFWSAFAGPSARPSLAAVLTVAGGLLALVGLTWALVEVTAKQRALRAKLEAASYALEQDRRSGDADMPRLREALGREHITYNDILWLPELFALNMLLEQFRSLRLQSAVVALGVVLSTAGSMLSMQQ